MMINLHSELGEHLEREEKLLWTGKPKTGIIFRAADIFMIPFSLLWLGFAIVWTIMAAQGAGIFALFGVPFLIIGFIFAFGRFIIDAKQRGNTIYGLTENRIIIKSGVFSKNIKSLNIRTINHIELNEKGDGTGTILIEPKNPFMIWGSGMNWWPGMSMSPQLELIKDARKVYRQIIEIQNNA